MHSTILEQICIVNINDIKDDRTFLGSMTKIPIEVSFVSNIVGSAIKFGLKMTLAT